MYQRILCPIDGSAPSTRGMLEAIHLAKEMGGTLHFLHIVGIYFPMLDMAGELNVDRMSDVMRTEGERILNKAVSTAMAEGITADCEMAESYGGRVGEAIVAAAEKWEADLIIMGTHGYHGINHFVMGSDAEYVARSSPVPVLLTRSTQPFEQHRKSEHHSINEETHHHAHR